MAISAWLVFICLATIQTGSPGPSTVNLINNAIRYGKFQAIFSLTGDVLAVFMMGVISSAGIDVFFSQHPALFCGLKILGAIYLIYLGFKSFSKKSVKLGNEINTFPKGCWKLWRQSFFIGISNPKAIIYFSALLPQFESRGTPNLHLFIMLVFSSVLIKFTTLSIYAFVAEYLSSKIKSSKATNTGNKLVGIFFMLFGSLLAASGIF
ncbi:LysE family translocator [Celerinatantimonas diazotrophica]|uniref:Threonine/homoserine/homoserine lactone efflux protein n=1 Tax=Celerinatantimonas diazotrophica TaxID=412034 RepID=A0A4R1JA54_9GAMM|nr:LysE family translocator [Celerinatantimonas diazotrophica]TCK47488.1 threonine/homoserine/homoserine lactone efflux protein [Celerinatantimonas diazotrophica]CAG9296894.1 Homoserine/homoserine lactone efflux protein [Celerinatantimonas diazotrophica]